LYKAQSHRTLHMSNIEQSFSLLLPSLSHHIPTELISLSNSLLAQSRNKASNLKSEEEIARPYACCELACKRLGIKLKLPALHARPPCAPRVYKKLLTFLEQTLPAKLPGNPNQDPPNKSKDVSSTRTTTPRKPAPRSAQSTPRTTTPRKKNTAFAGTIAPSRALTHKHNDDGAPPWVMPLIRRLCHKFSNPPLIPHVYTGLCVVLGLADLDSSQDYDDDDEPDSTYRHDVTSLTLALFFLVLSKMQSGPSSASYLADCETACAVAREGDSDHLSGPSKEAVDEWIKRISAEEWTTGQDWWSSVPEGVVDRVAGPSAVAAAAEEELDGNYDHNNDDDDDVELVVARKRRRRQEIPSGDGERGDPEGTLLPGLGTMMQESVDWLGEDRRADYLQWRAGVEMRLGRGDIGKGRKDVATRTTRAKGKQKSQHG
jgi:origin recognition complex subunit 6